MRNLIFSLWALFFGVSLLTLGNGLQGTLLGLRASLSGFETGVTGAVMACYYVGYVLGSLVTPVLIRRVGHIRVFAALASLVSFAPLAHSLFVLPWFWAVIRILAGISMAGIFIITESWLNNEASNENRGRMLSAYIIVCQLSMAGGQFLLNLADPQGFELFILMSALFSLAVVPIALSRRSAPTFVDTGDISLRELFARVPLTVSGVFLVSLGYGAFYAMGSVYALRTGFESSDIAGFMAAALFGAVVLQWPLGMMSDRVDRRKLVLAACLGVVAVGVALAVLPKGMPVTVQLLMFVFGGLSFPLYALFLALAGDYLEPGMLVAACSKIVLINGAGSALGPLAVAVLMESAGTWAFPLFIATVHLAAASVVFMLMRRTRIIQPENSPHFAPVSSQASFIAAEMAGREANDLPEPEADPDEPELNEPELAVSP